MSSARDGPPPLPRLCLVADGFASGRAGLDADGVQGVAAELVAAGLGWVWLRDHGADARTFDAAARRFAERLQEIDARVVLSVGTHLATARAVGAHLHVGGRGSTSGDADAIGIPFGVSAHSIDEVRAAARTGAVYAMISPIHTTLTHPDARPLGLDAVADAAETVDIPILALGGMTPERAAAACSAGAWGVAVLSDLLLAPRPVWRLDHYLAALAD